MIYWSGGPIVSSFSNTFPNSFLQTYEQDETDWLFNNMRQGQTTNMSYDLRGDPIKIPKYRFAWNNSTLTPIYNKQLC
jgi:hypothetical protein